MSVYDKYEGTVVVGWGRVTHVAFWGHVNGERLTTTFFACDDGSPIAREILRRVRHALDFPTCLKCVAMLITR